MKKKKTGQGGNTDPQDRAFNRNQGCFLLLNQTFQKKVEEEEVDSVETDSRGFCAAVEGFLDL